MSIRADNGDGDLHARLERLEDRAEIGELLIRYSVARDDRELDTLLGYFAEEAEFHRAGEVVRGREEIRAFFERSRDRYAATVHTVDGHYLDWQEDGTAKGLVMGHAELVLDGRLIAAGYRYRDVYVKEGGRWLIGRRSLDFMYAAPIEELPWVWTDRNRIRWPGQDPTPADYPDFA